MVTTCSPRNFDYVKSLGADEAFDYSDPGCADKIRAHTGGKLALAWDCVSNLETGRICASAIDPEQGGKYWSLLYVPDDVIKGVNAKITSGLSLAYTAFGEAFDKFRPFEANLEDFGFAKAFWELTVELVAAGKIKPARHEANRGGKGLEGVLVGLKELKEDRVSGVKLVYTL